MAEHARLTAGGGSAPLGSIRVRLRADALDIAEGAATLVAVPSMNHPAFRRILERGWVSPPSFGPKGDLRLYSAAHTPPGEDGYAWFASADWRRGRIQVDRQGAISDIAMAPYGGGRGKASGEPVEIVLDYSRATASITVGGSHSALGKWSSVELALEADAAASKVVDAAIASAIFLWCARPERFLVAAKPPF